MSQELVSEQGLRLDGRRSYELRKLVCKMGVYETADGSAYMEQGNTKVLVTVYGPYQATSKISETEALIINCQYSLATFAVGERKVRLRGDRKTQELTTNLKNALSAGIRTEIYDKSQIDVFVEIIQADGNHFGTAINAVTLALIDAGIAIKDYICACTVSLGKDDIPLIDVSHVEQLTGGPVLTVASLPKSDQIAFMEMSQRFHLDKFDYIMQAALSGCNEIKIILDKTVRQHLIEIGSANEWNSLRMK